MRFDGGTQFAGYTVVSRLGRGGMATVYLAREPGIDRLVALKVLPEQLTDDVQFAARFEQEARVIASLDHPNIIPLYRYGIDEEVPWMALRYVDGGDLAVRLAARPIPAAEGITILRGVAAALDYAHRKGVIHRDLKPQNILLTEDGSPYLADFGIAKLLESADSLKTATGSLFGTPAYMAPEQAMGHPLGPYTDVYALAVICFRWLTGRLPFDADTPQAILFKHVQDPLPPTAMGLLSTAVASVVDRGLAKDPQARFQSAGAFVSELEKALHLMPVAAATVAVATREVPVAVPVAKRTAARRRSAAWLGLGAATALIAAGAVYWRQFHIVSTPDPPSDTPATNVAQSSAPQTLPPGPKPVPAMPVSGTVVVEANADCRLAIDGVVKGVLGAGQPQDFELPPGVHRVQCVSAERKTAIMLKDVSAGAGDRLVVTLDVRTAAAQAKKAEEAKAAENANALALQAQPRVARDERATADHYTALAGGVVRDASGNKEWTQRDSTVDTYWGGAAAYCSQRGSSWRLPTIGELTALYGIGAGTRCGSLVCRVSANFLLTGTWYWSATRDGTTQAWSINFASGLRHLSNVADATSNRTLCVRDAG